MTDDDRERMTLSIHLPAPVDQVAAVARLLGEAWPEAKVSTPGGTTFDILIPKRPAPKRVAKKLMRDILAETLAGDDDSEAWLVRLADGRLTLGVDSEDEVWQRLGAWAWMVLKIHEAANYVEQGISVVDPETGEPRTMLVTACWSEGQSPHTLRMKAERELAEVREQLAAARRELDGGDAMRVTFQPVRRTKVYHGRCPVCQRPVRRSRTFEHTVNPFNRRPDGVVKSVEEVYTDVRAESESYQPDFTHEACRRVGGVAEGPSGSVDSGVVFVEED